MESAERIYNLSYNAEMPEITRNKLRDIIKEKTENKNLERIVIHNNYLHTAKEISILELFNDLYEDKYIMSGFGALYEKHTKDGNPLIFFINFLLAKRKSEKKIELLHINDEDPREYNFHHIMQILYKLCNNAEYGASGEKNYIFGNRYIGPSTTYSGYIIITSCILYLESLMENNVYFENTNDFLRFVEECSMHKDKHPESILEWLDEPEKIDAENLFKYICEERFSNKMDMNEDAIRKICFSLTQEMRNRVYYANNLKKFLFQNRNITLLSKCYDTGFTNPSNPPESVKESITILNKAIRSFVTHPFIKWNRQSYAKKMKRRNIILVDSDSVFIYLGRFIRDIYEELFEFDEETKKTEAHKIAAAHIGNNIVANMIQDVLDAVTSGLNVSEDYQPDINMKSEFLFKRVDMTKNKKNYSAVIMVREGNILSPENPERVLIKGLPIRKVSTNKLTRNYFTDVLKEEFLFSEEINPKVILNKFLGFENIVYESLTNQRSTEFLVPGKFTNFSVYKNPFSSSVAKAVILWNYMYPSEKIMPYSKVNMLPIVNIQNSDDLDIIGEEFVEERERILPIFEKESKYFEKSGSHFIAIPKKRKEIPPSLVKLIDTNKIVEDNTKAAYPLMESIGFQMLPCGNSKVISTFINL
jgi:hypothetical protein